MKLRLPKIPLIRPAERYVSASSGKCNLGDSSYKNYDRGNAPSIFNLDAITGENENYRTALWTGEGMQITVMSIPTGSGIRNENHDNIDQLLKIVSGTGEVTMKKGDGRSHLTTPVKEGDAIMIPRGTWHSLKNTGRSPMKLYSVYAPKNHPYGTVHKTESDADGAEHSE